MTVKDFKKVCTEFIDSLEKSFEYIPKENLEKAKSVVKNAKSDLVQSTASELYKHSLDIFKVTTQGAKLKNNDFKFLEKVSLFEGNINLEILKAENKKTKSIVAAHLNNILATGVDKVDIEAISQIDTSSLQRTVESNNVLSNLVSQVSSRINQGDIDIPQLLGSMLTDPENAKNNPVVKDIMGIVERDMDKIQPSDIQNLTSDIGKLMNNFQNKK